MMKKLILLTLLLLTPLLAKAQGSSVQGQVIGPNGFPRPGALITFCTSAATGTPCTPTVTIYQDVALTIPLTQPLAADGVGNYSFFVTPGTYKYTVTGPGISSPQTFTITVPCTLNSGCAPWVDVSFYGAVGDDTTDDTVAIQAAMDAGLTAGACVRFQGKTYKTTSILGLGTAPCLIGDGSQRTIIHNIATTCFAKKAGVTSVYDAYLSGIGCRDNNTGTSTSIGWDFTEFNRSEWHDLDVWYKQKGYLFKRNGGGAGFFYNRGFGLLANDNKMGMDFDTSFGLNQLNFYATQIQRRAGTWDAGGGEIGVNLSGNGINFFGLYASAAGATSTALKCQAGSSQNIIQGLYVEGLPTTDVDCDASVSPNYIDGLLSDGRVSPIIKDTNLNLTFRIDTPTITLNGATGQPPVQWSRSANANGAGTNMRLGFTAFYPPGATADPSSPAVFVGALTYRSDLARLRWFDAVGAGWHSVVGADTTDSLTNKTFDKTSNVAFRAASVDLTAQAAAITTTTVYAVPASGAGQYRISWNAKVTTVDAVSSTLGALTIVYTDPDGVVQTITAPASIAAGTIATTSTGNLTTTVLLGLPLLLNCKASTNITYAMAYISNTPGQMIYNLHIKLDSE